MAVIKYKPTTNGRRNMSVPSFEEITKSTPEKSPVSYTHRDVYKRQAGSRTKRDCNRITAKRTCSGARTFRYC